MHVSKHQVTMNKRVKRKKTTLNGKKSHFYFSIHLRGFYYNIVIFLKKIKQPQKFSE